MSKLDEVLFNEIKEAKNDGMTSKECADEMNLDLLEVNKIYSASSYQIYSGKKSEISLLDSTKADYYKGLLAKKTEDIENMGETRSYLLEQISFLRKSVAFLEIRKRELEDGIKNLERNVRLGVDMMQQLEDNNNFKNEKTKKSSAFNY